MDSINNLMDEKPLVQDDSPLLEEEHDLPYYLSKFAATSVITTKKKIVKQVVTGFPDAKPAKLAEGFPTLSDQYRFLSYAIENKEKLNLLEKFTLYNKLTTIKSKISKEAGSIFRAITTNERKGKKFDGIVLGKIGPLITKNDSLVLTEVLEKLSSIADTSPLKKLHTNFIGDLKSTLEIVQKIKNEGINETNIEKIILEKQDKLLKPGMRTLLQNILFLDKNLLTYREPILTVLSKLTQEEVERNKATDKALLENLSLTELGRIQDVNNFVTKASNLLSKEEQSLEQITSLFNLLLNKPLINILKLLKFPLHRELLKSWFKEAPIPATHTKEIEKQMELVNIEFGQTLRKQKVPQNTAELLVLLYDLDLNFTDKYKLLADTAQQLPDKDSTKDSLLFFLTQIKTTQYKIEHKLISSIITQLKACFTMSEIDSLFTNEKEKSKKRLLSYKQALEKNLTQIFTNIHAEAQKILRQIVQEVKEEKIISISLILDLHKTLESNKQSLFIVKLINFLTCYYLYVFGKWILAYWHSYFSHLKTTDGLFIKNKLSAISKEEIFNFCRTYAKSRDLVKSTLLKYLQWGRLEKQSREHCLTDIKTAATAPQLSKGRYRIFVQKYGSHYTIIIRDAEGKIRLKKSAGHVVNFLDFLNIIHIHKIDTQLKINEAELKALYQYAHLAYLDELEDYLQDRLNILTDPLSAYTSEQIREEYHKSPEPPRYLAELRKKGKAEIQSREAVIKKLKDELFQTEESLAERITRIKKETAGQQAMINFKIHGLLKYIDKMEQKKLADAVEEQPAPAPLQAGIEGIRAKLGDLAPEKQVTILTQELAKISNEEEKVKTAADFLIHSGCEPVIRKSLEIIEKSSCDTYKILITLYKIFDRQKDIYAKLKILDEFCQKLFERYPDHYLELKYYLDIQRKNLLQEIAHKNASLVKVWSDLLIIKDNKEKIKYLEELLRQPAYQKLAPQIKCIIHSFLTNDIKEIMETNESLPAEDQLYLLGKCCYLGSDAGLTPQLKQRIEEKNTELEAKVLLKELPAEGILSEKSFNLLMQPESDPVQLARQLTSDFMEAEKNIVNDYVDAFTCKTKEEQKPDNDPLPEVITPEQKTENTGEVTATAVEKEIPPLTDTLLPTALNTLESESAPSFESSLTDLGGLQEEEIQYDDEGELDETEKITEENITNIEEAAAVLEETKSEEEEQIITSLEEKLKNNQISEVEEYIKNEIVLEQAKQKNYAKMARLLTTLSRKDFIKNHKEVKEQVEQYLKAMEPVIIETAKNELKNNGVTLTAQQLTKRTSPEVTAGEKKFSPKVEQFIEKFSSLTQFTSLQSLLAEENMDPGEVQDVVLAISQTMLSGNYMYLKGSNTLLGCGKLANLINAAFEQKLKGQTPETDIELLKDAWNFIRNHSARFNQFQMLGCEGQEERKELLIRLQQLTTGKSTTERFQPRTMKILKPLRQRKRHNENIQHSLDAAAETAEQAEREKPTRTFEASEDQLDYTREDIQKMKAFVQESYSPIINEWITNIFKNKSRNDFAVMANGRKTYYTKSMLKAVIQEMLKRDIKGKAHVPLLNTLQHDVKLFDVLIKELFDKQQTPKGYFIYFPKCLKSK